MLDGHEIGRVLQRQKDTLFFCASPVKSVTWQGLVVRIRSQPMPPGSIIKWLVEEPEAMPPDTVARLSTLQAATERLVEQSIDNGKDAIAHLNYSLSTWMKQALTTPETATLLSLLAATCRRIACTQAPARGVDSALAMSASFFASQGFAFADVLDGALSTWVDDAKVMETLQVDVRAVSEGSKELN